MKRIVSNLSYIRERHTDRQTARQTDRDRSRQRQKTMNDSRIYYVNLLFKNFLSFVFKEKNQTYFPKIINKTGYRQHYEQ